MLIPSSPYFDFGSNQSFTIDVWFKTTQTNVAEFIRRGLAPQPGFMLRILEGRVQGMIGNRENGTPPDTLLAVTSTQSYNDGNWHLASLERDRARNKLSLYVDGLLAATPIDDYFPNSLSSVRPVTMGTWESGVVFFAGMLDEIRISNIARHAAPVVSDTVGLWHLDETAGTTLYDSSPFRNNATASGTSVVSGAIGNARHFNGYSSYATIPSISSYNFSSSESFTVSVWVKTSGPEGIIVRRGLDPIPGFQISIHYGRAIGRIGNTKGNTWSDTLLTLTSSQLINDNVWHEIRMVRDRGQGKLFLYVDGLSSTTPAVDNFTIPLTNTRPLTFGASLILPDYFSGPIDEVGIFRGARHPAGVTSDTVALWHYDESTGNTVFDSSPYRNTGTVYGTTIAPGRFGNARYFNGSYDYVRVPSNPVFNMNTDQSFTVDLWFKTSGTTDGWMIRRGLAPVPGFSLGISGGRVLGEIGNREDGTPPDTLLMLFSERNYVDGVWHHATFIRDRAVRKLFLYVDGELAAGPMTDNFPIPLTSDRPLTMGRWETNPEYFRGYLDEVAIFRGARHPAVVTSDTLALYHLNETSGTTVLDSSPYANNGTAFGTAIIPGPFGNARNFNGISDYVSFPNPYRGQLNFSSSESFTIEAYFKTTGTEGHILRRGLVFSPGFLLGINYGRLAGMIGNHQGRVWSDTLLKVLSDQTVNDGNWHRATFVRDRSVQKLFLYVDGALSSTPIVDNFTIPLVNDRPLTLGRWEDFQDPWLFRGGIDEVKIYKGARHPVNVSAPSISISPGRLDFGNVIVGGSGLRTLTISNAGLFDTLRVTGIESSSNVFTLNTTPFSLAPGASRNIQVTYTPTSARVDTGAISIVSNDPSRPIVRVPLSGQGFTVGVAPFITSIRDIPDDQGKQVRVIWYKSIHDANGDSLRITEYSVWRRVGTNNALWDFVASIPAVRFDQYSFVAPTLFDSTQTAGIRWSVFKVSAQTANGAQVYFSSADSGYSVDNLPPSAPANLIANIVGGRINLAWDQPADPDVQFFAIYRSTSPNVLPTGENQIGTAAANSFVDQTAIGNTSYYYCIAAFDTAGNQSGSSNQIQVILTSIGGGGLPTAFRLYQNYPNPFNPTSVIRYDVPNAGHVSITLYDMLGRVVATLVDENKSAGTYQTSINAGGLSSGMYLYRMQAGSYVDVKKMVLMK